MEIAYQSTDSVDCRNFVGLFSSLVISVKHFIGFLYYSKGHKAIGGIFV